MMCEDITLQRQQDRMIYVRVAFVLIGFGHTAIGPTRGRMLCNFVRAYGNGHKQVHLVLVAMRPKLPVGTTA